MFKESDLELMGRVAKERAQEANRLRSTNSDLADELNAEAERLWTIRKRLVGVEDFGKKLKDFIGDIS